MPRVLRTPDVDTKPTTRKLLPLPLRIVEAPRADEPPSSPAVPGQIDPGIRQAVLRLQEAGVETCESCEGGPGHAYPEPTVAFYGGQAAGWRAVQVCMDYGLPVMSLRRVWNMERDEPTGPHWEITFRRRMV